MNKFIRNILYVTLYILLIFTVILGSIFIPKYILNMHTNKTLNVTISAPEEYYLAANSAMAKSNSAKLSPIERINLITGVWSSTMTKASPKDAFISETDAVDLAIHRLNFFYEIDTYPFTLLGGYDNWYSWSTEVYKYTDASFNTYTAYLWIITFTKFDNSLKHTVAMTEDGIILAAEVNTSATGMRELHYAYAGAYLGYITGNNHIGCNIENATANPENIPSIYPNITIDNSIITNASTISLYEYIDAESNTYTLYQYGNDEKYGIGIVPSN